jgi:eukaryotic-like serine/threonine-protein kinase
MSIAIGSQLGSYEITALLGKGGMGEVYRARDTKLKREVAIKILPEEFLQDPDRVNRFQREAELLASLNHTNIAAIHDLQEGNGSRFLIMELVEGETLADRITRGPLPLDDALSIARQICEALEAAHEKGIVHRDLKPANVKVLPDGKVKVLDFGLAKAFERSPAANPAMTNSPTLSMAATNAGLILGTASYMSPEQAKGKTVDRRTDIFALGCVLFEMLTGRRAFDGEDIPEILSRILQREPDWKLLPPSVPPKIRDLLRLCMEKDVRKRRSDAADVRIDIEHALSGSAEIVSVPPSRTRERLWMGAAVAFLITMLVLTIPTVLYFRSSPAPDAPEIRTEINTPASSDPVSFALSPDGQQLVYVASGDGPSRLWLRSLMSTSAQPLAGTEGAAYPFWSPDSRSIGFFADGRLKRLDIGGSPQALSTVGNIRGGSWNKEGIILVGRVNQGLFRVSAAGGEAVPVTKLDRQISHRFPYFLPDGRRFLFYSQGTPETGGLYLGSLDSAEIKRVAAAADTSAAYTPAGWLVWIRAGTLVAQHLDLERGELTGDPVVLVDPVTFDAGTFAGAFSVSATGLIAYRSGNAGRHQLSWFDRSGKMLGAIGAPDESGLSAPRLSPDGRRVAVWRTVQNNSDVWLLDGARTSRFTFDAALDRYPVWSPDGSRIVFDSNRKGTRNFYVKPSSGASSEELFLETPQDKTGADWSADGRFFLYHAGDAQTTFDIWVMPLEGDHKPQVFLKTNFDERWGKFSPDGRWIAYMSNESGRFEVYVRPFVAPAPASAKGGQAGGQWQVSTAGGIFPTWRPDGKELYYIGLNSQIMAAPVVVTGTTLEPGTPVALFQTRIYGGGGENGQGRQYDVSRDGRFLINTIVDEATFPITLLQNWKPPKQ